MIQVRPNNSDKTVIVFSGMSAYNYIYEWTNSFNNLPVNLIGVRDSENKWYQTNFNDTLYGLEEALFDLKTKFILCLGGSAGGFAALAFGKALTADKIVAFCPQSVCGKAKRNLGDMRWPEICHSTPSFDISGTYPKAEIHYSTRDSLDTMHAKRFVPGEFHPWPEVGHDLPHFLKVYGHLRPILEKALASSK